MKIEAGTIIEWRGDKWAVKALTTWRGKSCARLELIQPEGWSNKDFRSLSKRMSGLYTLEVIQNSNIKMAFKFKKVKIHGRTHEEFQRTLIAVLNIASVIARRGVLPNDYQREHPQSSRGHWFLDSNSNPNRYELCPAPQNYWADVREVGETYVVLTFHYWADATGHSFHDAVMAAVDFQFTDRYENILE